MTVISSIIEQLKEEAGSRQLSPYLSTKLASLLKATAPIVTKALFKKVSGINIDEVQEVITADDAGKLVESLFQDTRKKTEAVQLLKHEIQQWVGAIIGKKKKQAPAFILIDELDRCRPTYAVEMLETIKHIFDIPGVVFVLATDTEQLQHAVKVIYGSEFDAYTYLSRFFSRRFSLLAGSKHHFIENHLLKCNLLVTCSFDKIWPKGLNIEAISIILSSISDACQLSLRSTEKLIDRMTLVLLNLENDDVNVAFLAYLMALHEMKPSDYEMIITMVRSRQKLENVKIQNINPKALNELKGSVNISMRTTQSVDFVDGDYSINVENLIRDYLWSYLGEHEHASAQLVGGNKNLVVQYPRYTRKEHSEALKYSVLNTELYEKSRLDMSVYRDWVELATSFE